MLQGLLGIAIAVLVQPLAAKIWLVVLACVVVVAGFRMLLGGVRVDGDELVVRNPWRSYRVHRELIERLEIGERRPRWMNLPLVVTVVLRDGGAISCLGLQDWPAERAELDALVAKLEAELWQSSNST